jgi:hypothetical protein
MFDRWGFEFTVSIHSGSYIVTTENKTVPQNNYIKILAQRFAKRDLWLQGFLFTTRYYCRFDSLYLPEDDS